MCIEKIILQFRKMNLKKYFHLKRPSRSMANLYTTYIKARKKSILVGDMNTSSKQILALWLQKKEKTSLFETVSEKDTSKNFFVTLVNYFY